MGCCEGRVRVGDASALLRSCSLPPSAGDAVQICLAGCYFPVSAPGSCPPAWLVQWSSPRALWLLLPCDVTHKGVGTAAPQWFSHCYPWSMNNCGGPQRAPGYLVMTINVYTTSVGTP